MYLYTKELTLPTLVIFLTMFQTVHLESNHLIKILELKDNLFYIVNEKIHNTINRLFTILKLESNFLKSSKIMLLLTMHSDLNNIAVKNFNVYKQITNISKVDNNGDADGNIMELKTILDHLVKEYQNEEEKKNYTKVTEVITLDNITVGSSSIESLDFKEDFLRKINSLTEDNFTRKNSNGTLKEEFDMFSVIKRNISDLKIWSPPTSVQKQDLLNNLTRRIYKGKRTWIKNYPFIASVHVLKEFMCSGSIISRNWVITAASCLQIVYNNKKLRENPKNLFIRVGSDYTKRFGETIDVNELHFHPEYDPFSLQNNLLLLKLAKQIKFLKKKRKIRRILYDRSPHRLRNVDEVTILGWGATDNMIGVKTYQPLAVADIAVYSFEGCQDIYSKSYVTEKNFCIGFVYKGGGACKGDVGGPGVVNGVLMGVISYGPPVCGANNMPTVLVKLGYYAKWIKRVMEQESTITSSLIFKTSALIITEAFPTTSTKQTEEPYPENPNYVRTSMTRDYPEEIAILNQILNEVILSNKTVIDDILYGAMDDNFEDIFTSSSKLDIYQHPLANKSLFLLPEVHDFDVQTTSPATIPLTTSSAIRTTPYIGLQNEHMAEYDERIKYWDNYSPRTTFGVTTLRPVTTTTALYFTDKFGRARKVTLLALSIEEEKEYSKVESYEDSEKISDNYENKKEIEESEGLSIEVTESAEEHFVSKKSAEPKTKTLTSKITIVSSESEIEYKPKKIIFKTTQSLKIPYKFRGKHRKVTEANIKNNLRNTNPFVFLTKKSYNSRDRLLYESDY